VPYRLRRLLGRVDDVINVEAADAKRPQVTLDQLTRAPTADWCGLAWLAFVGVAALGNADLVADDFVYQPVLVDYPP
jgi:hypothetical protein